MSKIYTSKTHPQIYNIWNHMRRRCTNPKIWIKYPHYQGCTIHDLWKDFENFAYCYENMVGYGLPGRQLDKDILFKGNTIYGPHTCVLVPQDINIMFTSCKNARGLLPIGVSYEGGKYRAKCRLHGTRKFLGCFKTPEEAFMAYKKEKESHIKEIAERYKHEIDPRLYFALLNYEVEITD